MRLSVYLAMILVAFAGMASAYPLCTNIVDGNGSSTMAAYVAMGQGTGTGCTIGDKLFSTFIYGSTAQGNGVAVPATAVFLTPVDAGTDSPGPGILFSSSGWKVLGPADSVDSSIFFTVTVLPGGNLIDDAGLSLVFGTTGTGVVADITETLNPMGLQLQVDSNGPFVSHKFFTPTNTVSVSKDLLVEVFNGATGTATISNFTENFSEIPEPVGLVLIGSGLLALGAWRRRVSHG